MAWKDAPHFSHFDSFGVLSKAKRTKIEERGTLQMVASHSEDKKGSDIENDALGQD